METAQVNPQVNLTFENYYKHPQELVNHKNSLSKMAAQQTRIVVDAHQGGDGGGKGRGNHKNRNGKERQGGGNDKVKVLSDTKVSYQGKTYRNDFYKDCNEFNALPYAVKVAIKEEHQKKRPQTVATAISEAFECSITAAKTSNNEVDEDTTLTEPTTGTSQSGTRTSAQARRAGREFGRRNGYGNSN
eukprot:14276586-Ditylum_brightwellii.AAC.1